VAVLTRVYPAGGAEECARQMPRRSAYAILFRASQMGLRRIKGTIRRKTYRGRPVCRNFPASDAPQKPMAAKPVTATPVAKATAPSRPVLAVIPAADVLPGMVVNRYPVGTTAKRAMRRVTSAQITGAGKNRWFSLHWVAEKLASGKLEFPGAMWSLDRIPDLAFEVDSEAAR